MVDIWWLLPALLIGTLIGAMMMGLFAIASEEDDREERRMRRDKAK